MTRGHCTCSIKGADPACDWHGKLSEYRKHALFVPPLKKLPDVEVRVPKPEPKEYRHDLTTVIATMRFLASGWVQDGAWDPEVGTEPNGKWLSETADDLERVRDHSDWLERMTCPLCEETECDEGCPCYAHRKAAGCW